MISVLKDEDIVQIVSISDRLVGEGYLTYESIKDCFCDMKRVIKVFKANKEVIGFAKGRVSTKSELKRSLLKINSIIDEELCGRGYIGVLETICVKEEKQRIGIGKELSIELINSLKLLKNVKRIYITVWKSADGANSKRLVEKLGFEYITEIPNYWYEDSIEKGYICPKCGNPPCKCSMILYRL